MLPINGNVNIILPIRKCYYIILITIPMHYWKW